MKTVKFLAKCILALLPAIAIIAYISLCPFMYMDEEYPAWRFTKEFTTGPSNELFNNTQPADTIILGDSRAMADLLPEKLGDKNVVNLALGGATSIEMYYFYKEYLKNNTAPSTVIVMFAPFHYSYIDNYKTRTAYFNALNPIDTVELNGFADFFDASSILFDDYREYSLSCRLHMPNVYLPAIYNSRFTGRYDSNHSLYDKLLSSCGQGYFGTADGCSDPAYEASYTEMAKDGDAKLLAFYFEKLLKLLENSSVQVILAQPPMNETTYDSLNEAYVSEYANFIQNECSPFKNIVYEDSLVRYDNEYFGDSSHLNEKGAIRFSEDFYTKYEDLL